MSVRLSANLLIQQLVTSNPTPAYVGRVAAAFNDNGQGIRGDMKAVVRAILTDPEARGNVKTDPDYGKLREPVLFVTNTLRPFNPAAQSQALGSCQGLSDGVINTATADFVARRIYAAERFQLLFDGKYICQIQIFTRRNSVSFRPETL